MLAIGLTGGIGTGKSEVVRLLRSLGAAIIDADQVGHQAYTPGSECWRQVVDAFGREVLQANGEIDRKKLGSMVFADPQQLARLNAIMHPGMAQIVKERIQRLQDQGVPVVVVEAAVLFEAGWDSLVDEVWTTDSPLETVVQRLQARNGLSEPEVRRRINSQMDRAERLARADVVIDNSGDIASLEKTVKGLWENRVKGRIGQA